MMAGQLRYQHHWVFCVAALAVWLALGWPFLQAFVTGAVPRGSAVPALWLVPFILFGVAVFGAIVLKLRMGLQWALLSAQLAAVVAMTIIYPNDLVSVLLVIIAWQVAMATAPAKALVWVAFQTLAVIGALAQAPDSDFSYVTGLSLALQLCFVLTAQALRTEAQNARALARTNGELRSAQALIANTAREVERMRISRELHDAWAHELTALGLQLEIASNVTEPSRANIHAIQAKDLARALLSKVRGAVSALREAERFNGMGALTVRDWGSAGTGSHGTSTPLAARRSVRRHHWVFGLAGLAVWLALGSPVLQTLMTGGSIRGTPVSPLWLVPFSLFGAAILAWIVLKPRLDLRWTLLCVQLAAVVAMASFVSWAMMSVFLAIVAWQVAMATAPAKALVWVVFQTLAVIGALALAPTPDFCWVIGLSFALQLSLVFAAQALQREAETGRTVAQANRELRSAQAIIATTARDAERLCISRELHDAWGHELTALGLQLEISSHVSDPDRAKDHVMQAKGLARALLAKVRDVVATLREVERRDLKDALEVLAHSIPKPAIHVNIAAGVRVTPDQAHALIRCAQEAVTNAVRHSEASNLWLHVTLDGEGVRLIARNDGSTRPTASSPGSGLLGMRERVESLGGNLAVRTGLDFGFMVDAWLPSRAPQAA